MKFFCPFMSTADKKVECTSDCSLYLPISATGRCSFLNISISLSEVKEELSNIFLAMPTEED